MRTTANLKQEEAEKLEVGYSEQPPQPPTDEMREIMRQNSEALDELTKTVRD